MCSPSRSTHEHQRCQPALGCNPPGKSFLRREAAVSRSRPAHHVGAELSRKPWRDCCKSPANGWLRKGYRTVSKILRKDVVIGAVGGAVATVVAGHAQSVLARMTPSSAKAREPDTPEGSSARAAARMLLTKIGHEPREQTLEAARGMIHYGLGAAWGPLYCVARRRGGMTPLAAGITTGTSLALIMDEFVNSVLGTTAPCREYPASAHVRGLLTHLVWGITAAATAEVLYWAAGDRPSGGRGGRV
jgi:uncharacterized membrane protein YagU involved in acid resistance